MTHKIELTDEQFAALQSGESITITPPKKVWEPDGQWYVAGNGEVWKNPSPHNCVFGNAFPTEEAAEKAAEAMRRHNRLLAYVAEFDGDWEPDWSMDLQEKFYVYYNHNDSKWRFSWNNYSQQAEQVYMSKECAEGLANKLNSGEVVL